MFGSSRVTLEKELLARLRRHAERAGYSSAEEFITHVLEKALADADTPQSEDELRKRLKGLGYIA